MAEVYENRALAITASSAKKHGRWISPRSEDDCANTMHKFLDVDQADQLTLTIPDVEDERK